MVTHTYGARKCSNSRRPICPYSGADRRYIADVKALAILVLVLSGCSMYFGDGEASAPDAAVTEEPDAAECEPPLPTCFSLGCAVGAVTPNCPIDEDTSVCYCPAAKSPGWCRS